MHKEIFYTNKDIKDFRLVVFSDIHYHDDYPLKLLNKIVKQTKEAKPDYITILGDILDSTSCTNLDPLKSFLEEIASIAPTIVILGNHDEKSGYNHHWESLKNNNLIGILKSIKNLHYLEDSNYEINNINFYGFKLSYEHYINNEHYDSFIDELNDIKPNLNDKNYNITLIHSPINIYRYLEDNPKHNLNKTDLILSGHMHNGVIPFWFSRIINKLFHTNRSLISPNKKFFPNYSQGKIYKRDGYIYQGLSKLSNSTRILSLFDHFFVKKIMVIEIKKHQ